MELVPPAAIADVQMRTQERRKRPEVETARHRWAKVLQKMASSQVQATIHLALAGAGSLERKTGGQGADGSLPPPRRRGAVRRLRVGCSSAIVVEARVVASTTAYRSEPKRERGDELPALGQPDVLLQPRIQLQFVLQIQHQVVLDRLVG